MKKTEWKAFVIGDMFDVKRGNAKDVRQRAEGGKVALVSAIDSNNAVLGMVDPLEGDSVFPPSLTVHNNGNGVGLVFVHPYNFVATSDVSVLTMKNGEFRPYFLRFLIAAIQKQKTKFNYGYKLANNRLKKQKIMLPADENGQPDFSFMEEYMRAIEKRLLARYEARLAHGDNSSAKGGGVSKEKSAGKPSFWMTYSLLKQQKVALIVIN